MRNLIDAVGNFLQIVQTIIQPALRLLTLGGDVTDVTDTALCQAQGFSLALSGCFQHRQRLHQRRQRLLISDNPIQHPRLDAVQRFPAAQRSLRVVCRVAGVLYRELAHRFDVMIKEHQRGERLIDGHTQDFAEAGKTGGGNAFEEMGIMQLIGITDTAQDTVVHQDRRGFAMLSGKSLPLLLRRLFKVFLFHQEQSIAKLKIAEKVYAARFNFGDRANKVLAANFNAESESL